MNTRNILVLSALLALSSCSSDDMPIPTVDAMIDKPISVSAGVAELISRGGMTSGDLSTLGLTITNAANTLYSYENVKYIKDGSTTSFVPAGGEVTPLWQNGTQEVAVSAWSPYVEGDLTGGYAFTVQADQTTAEAAKASDFLWTIETVDPDGDQTGRKIQYDNGSLRISLQHAMSKLVVNLRFGTEMNDVAIKNIAVKNLENSCLLDLETGTVQPPASSIRKDLLSCRAETAKSGYDVSYDVIFPPQKSAFAVMVELSDGRKFLHENSEYDFLPDHRYDLDILLGKDVMEIMDNGVSAGDWGDSADSSLEVQ